MKVLILAGGMGTRLGEETSVRPKPMVGIGGNPILWHIMKIYSHYGFNEFIILCGYKNEIIKDYFVNYYMNNSDVTVDLATSHVKVHQNSSEPWTVTMLYTGRDTMTAGRIKRAHNYVGDEPFMLTYGDGVGDIDIHKLIDKHKQSGKIVTLTAYQPEGRFGALGIEGDGTIKNFQEKPKESETWINAGFFVCQPEIFKYLPADSSNIMLEADPLKALAGDGQLNAYKHTGFWHAMDMMKDKEVLNKMWAENNAPWRVWKK